MYTIKFSCKRVVPISSLIHSTCEIRQKWKTKLPSIPNQIHQTSLQRTSQNLTIFVLKIWCKCLRPCLWNLLIVTDPERASILADEAPILGYFFLLQLLSSPHLLQKKIWTLSAKCNYRNNPSVWLPRTSPKPYKIEKRSMRKSCNFLNFTITSE